MESNIEVRQSNKPAPVITPILELNTPNGCRHFVDTGSAKDISTQLREDYEIVKQNPRDRIPSLLVHYLPEPTTRSAEPIYRAYFADDSTPSSILQLRYKAIKNSVKSYLSELPVENHPPRVPAHLIPSNEEFQSALKVLRYLQLHRGTADDTTPLNIIEKIIKQELPLGTELRSELRNRFQPGRSKRKLCYGCLYAMSTSPHPLYPGLCHPCGEFNLAESAISLPGAMNMAGRTAVVTGGRIHLGFSTALRLLRCGARVIVSSRYPLDAAHRYLSQPDAPAWKSRLRIIGSDFRSVADVFALTKAINLCLSSVWETKKLDILINNAAQTWTDSHDAEAAAIAREASLESMSDSFPDLLLNPSYTPQVRGGRLYSKGQNLLPEPTKSDDDSELQSSINQLTLENPTLAAVKSTWTQAIADIPYEDVVTTYTVNALTPFILTRELLPLLRHETFPRSPYRPSAHIINVSAREGEPESKPKHKRSGYHVHTNMAKAALNMLTETEAAVLWKKDRIAVNSVDPGALSADADWMKIWGHEMQVPIDWEDGAGRVLWPIAKGEKKKGVWGRFLKHYISVPGVRTRVAEGGGGECNPAPEWPEDRGRTEVPETPEELTVAIEQDK